MTRHVAWLRGVNLGKRQVRSADLKAAFEAMGFDNVKTLLASGNVLFDADPGAAGGEPIAAALKARFGFAIGTVLYRQDEIRALIARDPFAGRVEDEQTKLHVTFVNDRAATSLPMPCATAGDFEVVAVRDGAVFMLAFRQPDGRFGPGMEAVSKHFGPQRLWTSRNWNTVLKAAE